MKEKKEKWRLLGRQGERGGEDKSGGRGEKRRGRKRSTVEIVEVVKRKGLERC